jgi:hypothetical protein
MRRRGAQRILDPQYAALYVTKLAQSYGYQPATSLAFLAFLLRDDGVCINRFLC